MFGTTKQRGAVLAAVVLLAAAVGSVAAVNGTTIQAEPAEPGATATHTVYYNVSDTLNGTNLSNVTIDYTAALGIDVSDVSLQTFGVDVDSNFDAPAVNQNLTGVTTVDANTSTKLVTLEVNQTARRVALSPEDEIVIQISGVGNPTEAGSWSLSASATGTTMMNNSTQVVESPGTGMVLNIGLNNSDNTTTTAGMNETTTGMNGGNGTTNATQTDNGNGQPGFTFAVAALALLAAALVAVRRQ